MNQRNSEECLGKDKMLPLVLKMSLPGVAAQLINLLYSIVDRIYIGHIPEIGTDALAGIGITSSVIILITAFSAIVGVGAAPLASIALGAGERLRAEKILGSGAILLVLFSIVTSTIVYLFMESILFFIGASATTITYATSYLTTYLYGTLFVLIATGLNSFICAQGRPMIAMLAVLVGAILNITLDPLFIFTFNMGVRGAALATVISQFASASIMIYFLTSKYATLKLKREYLFLDRKIVWSIIALGISPFVMASTEAIVGFVLNGSLRHYGDIHISAMAVIQAALLCSTVPITGLAQGFTPIVGYNFGHKNMDRVRECFKISLAIIATFNFVIILTIILLPDVVSHIFTNNSELVDLLHRVMPPFFIGLTLFGIQRTCQEMFIALGQAKVSIFIALLRKVILLIPLAIILPKSLGVMGIYYAEAISDSIAAICCAIIFFKLFPKILKQGLEL